MNDMCLYLIQLRDCVDEEEINVMTPLKITKQYEGAHGTFFSVRTDQSGFVGLLCHFTDRGFVLLSFQRPDQDTAQ